METASWGQSIQSLVNILNDSVTLSRSNDLGLIHMRLRFSIRDLLWLTALAAMAVAWWLDHLWSFDELFETVLKA
jgi:hypothetical protein